jgi:hypothetical protein
MNRDAVEAALRSIFAQEDYDLFKALECDEDEGRDHFPEITDDFINAYKAHNKTHHGGAL